jgi:hypothetical protein
MCVLGLAEPNGGSIQNPASAQALARIEFRVGTEHGRIPKNGYAAELSDTALNSARLGLYGPGWREEQLANATINSIAGHRRRSLPEEQPWCRPRFVTLASV